MNVQKVTDYWIRSSLEDFEIAEILFRTRKYNYCLFFCHLFLEKILKNIIVKRSGKHAPYIHNLGQLALKTNLDFSDEQLKLLDIITTFNIRARYNNIKFEFYKKATKSYTQEYFNKAKEIYRWIKEKS